MALRVFGGARVLAIAFFVLGRVPGAGSNEYWEPHWKSRYMTILFQARQIGAGGILIYGDSNSEMLFSGDAPQIGCMVINAGIGGARIKQLADFAPMLAGASQPKTVHIMAGTNNLRQADDSPEHMSFEGDFSRMLRSFTSRGSKVIVWTIPPTAPSFANSSKRDELNRMILRVASEENAVVQHSWQDSIADSTGYALPDALMRDGVHLSTESQEKRLARILDYATSEEGFDRRRCDR